MRGQPTVLHLDLDAFFAAVEQRDKPSLRGRPVIVGGTGPRGVVATASYEARHFGVHSAMSTRQARSRCPHAAYLAGRFHAYREASNLVMTTLRALSPAVEPISLDEAYVDLDQAYVDLGTAAVSPAAASGVVERVTGLAQQLRVEVHEATGGLTASVGVATSKLVAKIASDLDKPDGLVVVPAGAEQDLLDPLPVRAVPGVGPATTERLRRHGVHTIGQLARVDVDELVRLLGQAAGLSLHRLSRAVDDRPVVPTREPKSVSVEDTFEHDLTDPFVLAGIADHMARTVTDRLARTHQSARTVTVKVRRHDFSTATRSTTLRAPTDDAAVVAGLARRLLSDVDVSDGVRLLGVGMSGLADWIQDDLFGPDRAGQADDDGPSTPAHEVGPATAPNDDQHRWAPGQDVEHGELGPGWVWGAGRGRVTVRFETRHTPPGPVRTFPVDDAALRPRR